MHSEDNVVVFIHRFMKASSRNRHIAKAHKEITEHQTTSGSADTASEKDFNSEEVSNREQSSEPSVPRLTVKSFAAPLDLQDGLNMTETCLVPTQEDLELSQAIASTLLGTVHKTCSV